MLQNRSAPVSGVERVTASLASKICPARIIGACCARGRAADWAVNRCGYASFHLDDSAWLRLYLGRCYIIHSTLSGTSLEGKWSGILSLECPTD